MTENELIDHIAWEWVQAGGDQYSFKFCAPLIDAEIREEVKRLKNEQVEIEQLIVV